jgi:hypothetical protein
MSGLRDGCWRGTRSSCPHKTRPILFNSSLVRIEQFFFESIELLVIQVELDLQRSIGHPSSAAEEVDHLIEHRVEVHYRPSTCASAASVCGNQKVMSIPRYISIAVDSAVRACSRWPVTAYSVPSPRWQ